MKTDVTVSVEASGMKIIQASAKMIKATKDAMADGFQPGADLPPMMAEAFSDFQAIIAAAPAVPGELAEDKIAFIKGANLGLYDVLEALGVK